MTQLLIRILKVRFVAIFIHTLASEQVENVSQSEASTVILDLEGNMGQSFVKIGSVAMDQRLS